MTGSKAAMRAAKPVSINCSAQTTIAVPMTKKRKPITAADFTFCHSGKGSFFTKPIAAIIDPARRNLMPESKKGGISSMAMKLTK